MSALITLDDVSLKLGDKIILQNICLSLSHHEMITIVGPNGAGKSTLLSVVMGLRQPTSGGVVRQPSLRIGYVPQFINRDKTMPITAENFLKLIKAPYDHRLATQLFDELSIATLLKTQLSDLSGGELRRVLLARALLNQPAVLILDEPTAGIDVTGQKAFYRRLSQWRDREKFAVLMVSHDLHLVMASTDRVICLNQHICCQGAPQQVLADQEYLAIFGHAHSQGHDAIHHAECGV